MPDNHADDLDRGLAYDMPRLLSRRSLLAILGITSAGAFAAACGGTAPRAGSGEASPTSPASEAGLGDPDSCVAVPEETAGPFPGDGSNGPNVLVRDGVVRTDIRRSFGDSSAVADGVAMSLDLTLQDWTAGCAPLAGAAIYVWQCDRNGDYSLYSPGAASENYLRGVGVSDSSGRVTFTSIFPGCYPGRWPHIHFEVFSSLDSASSAGTPLLTSQIALPEDVSASVYSVADYPGSDRSFAQLSLPGDMVFRDGWATQMAELSGTPATGLTARLSIPVRT
ncbi:intradiol ring-cleavage dioxygenase [Hoyosella altamirensis]|uniref:Protocatechuate 3,4-dioxygenase beta subunit n=1 Tax=Hoyosella altamirensis TaxID=616997 RepID=A0A839RP20_9ACTN|nr:intradiol ring-cleavage dioxygenase [Hoyosella altamirensis]MBB3037671.1 protocatechuate 3,4-dioxygenase beta subunit [Hoyosella altamirensis]